MRSVSVEWGRALGDAGARAVKYRVIGIFDTGAMLHHEPRAGHVRGSIPVMCGPGSTGSGPVEDHASGVYFASRNPATRAASSSLIPDSSRALSWAWLIDCAVAPAAPATPEMLDAICCDPVAATLTPALIACVVAVCSST